MTAMSRLTRKALDITLVSLRTVRPVVSNMWTYSKSSLENTKARPLVVNRIVRSTENGLDKLTNKLVSSLTALRDKQLPKEQVYIEKELEKIKDRISKKDDSSTSKSLKPALCNAWQYLKIEAVPPMTYNFFNGPYGKRLENCVGKIADGFITNIDNQIKDIEAEKAREIKRKIAEAKAAQEKIQAEAKRKAEEIRKKEELLLAKEAKAKQIEAEKKAKMEKSEITPPTIPKKTKKPKKKPRK